MRRIINCAIIALIVISLPYINHKYAPKEKVETKLSFTLDDIHKVYPAAEKFVLTDKNNYQTLNANNEVIGNFIASNNFIESNSGYAGEINVLIGFSVDKIIQGVVLLDNVESRDYVRQVNTPEFMNLWTGKRLDEAPTMRVDGVSGATFTSNAVIRAVKESSASYSSLAAAYDTSVYDILKIALFLLVIVLSLITSFGKKLSRYRTIYLILIIIIAGFILQNMLSIALFDGWLKGGISLRTSWMSVSLLAMALVMSLLGKNRYYCTFLCPMGAIQELVGKMSPFKKISLRFLRFKYFNVNDLFLLLIVVAMFSPLSIDFTYTEPFAAYAVTIASWGTLIFGGVVILLSLFFNRPWCAICPTGCLITKYCCLGKMD